MIGSKESKLLVIENGEIKTYYLGDKNCWTIGRRSKDASPDVCLHSPTVSRKQGRLILINGFWQYLDGKSINGTVYNGKKIGLTKTGLVLPKVLHEGDSFIFGGKQSNPAEINPKSVFALYTKHELESAWRKADTKGLKSLIVLNDDTVILQKSHLYKGMMIQTESGMAIYMGDATYINGDLKIVGL